MPEIARSNPFTGQFTDINVTTKLDKNIINNGSYVNTQSDDVKPKKKRQSFIVWWNVIIISVIHVGGVYGIYRIFTSAQFVSFLFCYFWGTVGGVGVTAGAHRLWAHRAYKAKLPLRFLLMLMQSAAVQTPIYVWVRDHRVHHKYTDTDADPHNSKRGFFFSHVGWLMMRKHPEVTRRGMGVDMTDIIEDPVVTFQTKYYWILAPVLGFIVPFVVPMIFWQETVANSFFLMMKRYMATLNLTWLVNSAAHMFGYRPYDKNTSPTDNAIVSYLAYGEGWHNYHHAYPWDYKAAELPYHLNLSTAFIDFFGLFGLAYDRKSATPNMIKRQATMHGDGCWVDSYGQSDKDKDTSKTSYSIITS